MESGNFFTDSGLNYYQMENIMRKDTLGKPYLHLKYIIAVFICLTVTANKVLATAEIPGTVVSSCNFEGPYYIVGGKDKIQKDWQNNYEWGKKDITLSIDTGITGAAQKLTFVE